MPLSQKSIENLQAHWLISEIRSADLEKISRLTNERLAQKSVGKQIKFEFNQNAADSELLNRAGFVYEIAVSEGLDELTRSAGADEELVAQAIAGSYLAYEILSLEPIPAEYSEKLYFVLRLSALAYCGDRWSDLRRWYNENQAALEIPITANLEWDQRLLYRIYECWIRLFRKDGWDDLSKISEIVAGLREVQQEFETEYLSAFEEGEKGVYAVRLVSLYHLAKSTEVVAEYILNGRITNNDSVYADPFPSISKHFDAASKAADLTGDVQIVLILRYLQAAARKMIFSSLWWTARGINSDTSKFVNLLTHRKHQAIFELLPPQKAALLEQNLLDPTKTALVIDLPTSGGKTLLAEFRILQTLNQFQKSRGWIAYVVPTRALSAQITRRLRKDLEPIGIRIEQLTASVGVDAFEESLLAESENAFDILVATPEKLSLLIKNNKVKQRPLALVVIDEAHNIESADRGMRLEFLIAIIKRDCSEAKFLLMLPHAEELEYLVNWLSTYPNSGQTISLGTTPWKPNECIVGLFSAVAEKGKGSNWHMQFETLSATKDTITFAGKHQVGNTKPFDIAKSEVLTKGKQKGLALQTAAIAKEMSARGTSIAVGGKISTVWNMAARVSEELPTLTEIPPEVKIVQDFLENEFGPDFQLIQTLAKGVGVHHAGLSDEVRALMEWLAESGKLKILCATTTIAQGLNFPVASVFLQTHKFPYGKEMTPREFWNLIGRAGRIGHDRVGVVGIAAGNNSKEIKSFVSRSTGALVSQLVTQLDELEKQGELANLSKVLWQDQWEDFRCYIAHLWAQKKNLDAVLSDTEQFLRQTFGYTTLSNSESHRYKADILLEATRSYAKEISEMPSGIAELSDSTGFSPEGVRSSIKSLNDINPKLKIDDWKSNKLFTKDGRMSELFEVMLNVRQIKKQLEKISGKGHGKTRLADITLDWINGIKINEIADRYFVDEDKEEDSTQTISNTCQAIYSAIVNNGTWGISVLSRCSGLNFAAMTDEEQQDLNVLPAMVYHGVNTESAVLMRMNGVPRSIAVNLGELFQANTQSQGIERNVASARNFLKELDEKEWQKVCPPDSKLTGQNYQRVWEVLSGESY